LRHSENAPAILVVERKFAIEGLSKTDTLIRRVSAYVAGIGRRSVSYRPLQELPVFPFAELPSDSFVTPQAQHER
jgi:hypothetical protein